MRQYHQPFTPVRPYIGSSDASPQYGPAGAMHQRGAPASEYAAQVDSVRLANQILATANRQAAEMRHEAHDQAAMSLAEARQEAAALMRQASDQAAATLATAEREAAEVRAAVRKLTAELGGVVSAYVTENLLSLPGSGSMPTAHPTAPQPAVSPDRPPVPPGLAAGPVGKTPAGNNEARSRHHRGKAMSFFAAFLVLFALTAGVTEVALHGLKFFG